MSHFRPHSRDWPLTSEQEPPLGANAIRLTQGWVAWVDTEDLADLAGYIWHVHTPNHGLSWYARRNHPRGHRPAAEQMHRRILRAPDEMDVDHRVYLNEIRVVDNRRCNLRLCTRQQNARNQRKPRGERHSQFKGVTWHKAWGKWVSRVALGGGEYDRLGGFDSEHHAALAYDYSVRKHFGEFARTNFPACEGPTWGAPDAA